MAVDAEYVEGLAGYVQDTDYTSTQLTLYLGWAEDDLVTDAPHLTGTARDRAIGLLVAHFIAFIKSGGGEFSTEKSGDWSGTRATAAGETPWLVAYHAHIAKSTAAGIQPSTGVLRADANGSSAFALSDQALPHLSVDGGFR